MKARRPEPGRHPGRVKLAIIEEFADLFEDQPDRKSTGTQAANPA